ncbi:MAG: phosphate acetyltransferase [Desulfovibrio sp.]|jgi:phosphate acetyltransferase|nr:phosphate acetyltransferase [Desulfovibrio sp.]
MAKNLYITAPEAGSGKSAIVLGMTQLLLKNIRKVAFFRPIIPDPVRPEARDHNIKLIMTHFGLDIHYEDTFAATLSQARELILGGNRALLLDGILDKYKQLEARHDFVLCEGADFEPTDAPFVFDLNADIAANLGGPVLMVVNARKRCAADLIAATQTSLDSLENKGLNVIACILNRALLTEEEGKTVTRALTVRSGASDPLLAFIIPEDPVLGCPTMGDVKDGLNAKVLYGHSFLNFLVRDYIVAAMQVGNFLDYLTQDSVIITPGDRSDIILGSLGTRYSSTFPDIAGILLTGGLDLPPSIHRLIQGWRMVPVPMLSVEENTIKTLQMLHTLRISLKPGDSRKINTALGLFDAYVDTRAIARRIIDLKPTRITPKMFEFNLIERAASRKMHIVLPEGEEERILHAADVLMRRNVAEITLLGNPTVIAEKITRLGLHFQPSVIQPDASPLFENYAETYRELRKKKSLSPEQSRDIISDPTYFGTMMVYKGHADGMVSGSVNTTAHTIRPAFEFIKTRAGVSIVSSIFLMCLKDRVLAFGDCAVNPNPTAEELAVIAISSAETAALFGITPKVAMLSYSSGSSGKGVAVDKVVEATRIARQLAPSLLLEGPLQYDAAIDPKVAQAKVPGSQVAGHATVFIFPDLNTGNNTYKAVQRSADDVVAIGPILQGLNKPVNDLSRGCSLADIVNTVAITAVQAQGEAERAGH